MATKENDSFITVGLDMAEETEKSVNDIASDLQSEAPAAQQQAEPDQASAQLQEARDRAEQARQIEAAEHEQEKEHELEGPER